MREFPTGGVVVAICKGTDKGGPKRPLDEPVKIKRDFGIPGDAEAEKQSLLQVKMLPEEGIIAEGGGYAPGANGENILTRGVDTASIEHGTILRIGDAGLQLTWRADKFQKYRRESGDTKMTDIFATYGVFLTVLKSGCVKIGDRISIIIEDGVD